MGEKEAIKCLSEVSRTDPGLRNSTTRGVPPPSISPMHHEIETRR
jgi:hypothetical protein